MAPGFSSSQDDWCIPILRDFAEEMTVRNDVSMVALRYPQPARRYRVAGIEVVAVGGGRRKGLSRIALLLREIAVITREVRRRSADVIHAFWAHEPGAAACVAGRITGVPVVVTVMGGELAALPKIDYGGLLTPGNRTLARFCLGRADRIVTLCRFVHDIAATRVEKPRLCRLDFGVRTDRFCPEPKTPSSSPEGTIRFIVVGSLVPVKGHEMIVRAFARCHAEQPRTTLDLVGEGPLLGILEQQVRDLGLGSAVRFVGAIDHARLVECYRSADVLVLGSLWEGGSPQVALEALACGIPIVGTAVGIVPELTDAARSVPVGDAEALGREMARVAASAEIRTKMTAATAEVIRPVADCVAEHERLYDSIRRHHPASPEENSNG